MPRNAIVIPKDEYFIRIRKCKSLTRTRKYKKRKEPSFVITYNFGVHKIDYKPVIRVVDITGGGSFYKSFFPLSDVKSHIQKKITNPETDQMTSTDLFKDFEHGKGNSGNGAIYGAILLDLGVLKADENEESRLNTFVGWKGVEDLIRDIVEKKC